MNDRPGKPEGLGKPGNDDELMDSSREERNFSKDVTKFEFVP